MDKKRVKLIPVILLLSLSACGATPSTPKTKEASDEENSSFEQLIPTPPLDDIWDTADTDISQIDENRKLIAFTFDDAPSRSLESIFAVFAAYNENHPTSVATATVFFNGSRFDDQTQHLLFAACALGFELGNHTERHLDLTTLSKEEIRREISRTDERLQKIDGKPYHLLRAPFGKISEEVKEVAYTPIIDWTIDTRDWTGVNAQTIYDCVWENKFSGAIALMHDGYEATVSALKRLLPDLAKEGYQAVTLSQMIKAHGCQFRRGGVYIRARKNAP